MKYILDYYTMSDCSATATIEAETPEEAEAKLRRQASVDYVTSVCIDTRVTINTATHCPACRKTHQECDCIPL